MEPKFKQQRTHRQQEGTHEEGGFKPHRMFGHEEQEQNSADTLLFQNEFLPRSPSAWQFHLSSGTKIQDTEPYFGLRQAQFDGEARKLVVAVQNDSAGNNFLESLREPETQARLGFRFIGTLGELLELAQVERAANADEMSDKFAFLEIRAGYDFPVMNGILRHGCGTAMAGIANVDIESDSPMNYSLQQGLGSNYVLRSAGSSHDTYLRQLNVQPNRSAQGVRIAVVDSGFEKPGTLRGFLDMVNPGNKTETDKFGHGTAMASIIADIAPGADVFSVRAADGGPGVSEAMLGVAAASFHFDADIVNLSFGLPLAQTCTACGSISGVSKVFYRLLRNLAQVPSSQAGPPILVAATGNDGVSTGFDAPAAWDFTLAVGSITQHRDRSSFSNYGTTGHAHYIMMPGGEESHGAASEWIGEAAYKCYGTSSAAAYATGMLALYLANPAHSGLDRATFLSQILANCQPCNHQNATVHGLGYLPWL